MNRYRNRFFASDHYIMASGNPVDCPTVVQQLLNKFFACHCQARTTPLDHQPVSIIIRIIRIVNMLFKYSLFIDKISKLFTRSALFTLYIPYRHVHTLPYKNHLATQVEPEHEQDQRGERAVDQLVAGGGGDEN